MKFTIKDFFSKYEQIHSFQRIWSHLLKKSLMVKPSFFVQCRKTIFVSRKINYIQMNYMNLVKQLRDMCDAQNGFNFSSGISPKQNLIEANLNTNFTIWPRPINRRCVIHLYTTKQYFLHNWNSHSFLVALFSFFTFFILHFSCVPFFHIALFLHSTFFMLHFFLILYFSMLQSFTWLSSLLHYFQVPLFSCCTFSMLYFFLVVLSKSIKRLSFAFCI